MTRRAFLALLGGAAAAVPFAAKGQGGERRVGIISGFVEVDRRQQVKAFKQSLAERGWLEGQNLRIDYRSSNGDAS
jgi:putative ABC transport system substrate-binding protein